VPPTRSSDAPLVGPLRAAVSSPRVSLMALVALVGALVVSAYYPFSFQPPRLVTNSVVRDADGSLSLGSANRARTAGTPAWLDEARQSERVKVHLDVLPRVLQEGTPIMMLAADYWHTDFAFVQEGTDLELWFRRIGSTDNGDPPWGVAHVFRPGQSTDLVLAVADDRLTLAVNGTVRLAERLPPGSLRQWSAGRVALGSEVNGGGSWQGLMRTARVETQAGVADYVLPGAVEAPHRFLEIGDHVAPFPPPDGTEWLVLFLHLASFVPVGFLLVPVLGGPPRVRKAVTWAAGIALALAAAKFLFPRHTSVADVVVQVTGAALGALLAVRLLAIPAEHRARHDVGPAPPRTRADRDDDDRHDVREVGLAGAADMPGVSGAGAGQWTGQTQGATE
jgi:hypothetical protein